jgi:hypothetical protein
LRLGADFLRTDALLDGVGAVQRLADARAQRAGQWLLTRTRDDLVRSIASGDTVDGLTITPSAVAATDRFLLRPVARAAVDLERTLDDPPRRG